MMTLRFLVACPDCRIQHDAGELAPGSRFHCTCGRLLDVPRGGIHDAAVVRCGLCGASKPTGLEDCPYCGGEFTLHEKDLDTVCSSCLARVSGQARFCHSCGNPLVASTIAGEISEKNCPACESSPLHSRNLPDLELGVMECGRCAGLWLSQKGFSVIVERARDIAVEPTTGQSSTMAPQANDRRSLNQGGKLYRKCPECQRLMHRTNYSRYSGVLIDSCADHGLWFDVAELERILGWIKAGGEKRATDFQKQEAAERRASERARTRIDKDPSLAQPMIGFDPEFEGSPLLRSLYWLGRIVVDSVFWKIR